MVVSSTDANRISNLIMVCPMSSSERNVGNPMHITFQFNDRVQSVLCENIHVVDFELLVEYAGEISKENMNRILNTITRRMGVEARLEATPISDSTDVLRLIRSNAATNANIMSRLETKLDKLMERVSNIADTSGDSQQLFTMFWQSLMEAVRGGTSVQNEAHSGDKEQTHALPDRSKQFRDVYGRIKWDKDTCKVFLDDYPRYPAYELMQMWGLSSTKYVYVVYHRCCERLGVQP